MESHFLGIPADCNSGWLSKEVVEKGQVHAILNDISKAFDKLPYHDLNLKLEFYEVCG